MDTAGAVGPDLVALYKNSAPHKNSAPRGRFLMYAAGVFFLVALAFARYPISGIPTPYRWICEGTAGACGLSYIPLALHAFSRGRASFLILGPDAMAIAGLDRPIGWEEIEKMNLSTKNAAVPLAGLSAALLRIDERQGRIGGTTALVRSGKMPAMRVPPAPPIPHIPIRPVTARLGAGEAQRLIAAVRKAQRAVLVREDCTGGTGSLTAEAFALDDRRALVFVPCLMGAYQGSSVAFVAQRGGPAQQRVVAPTPYLGASADAATTDLFTEADFDPKTGMLAMFAKGRGLADCGMSASWIWDGGAFRLAEMTLQNACGGMAAGEWPMLFR